MPVLPENASPSTPSGSTVPSRSGEFDSTAGCVGVSSWLARQPAWVMTTYAMLAAFAGYMCMYAFRRPFAVIQYDHLPPVTLLGIPFGYKPIALVSQLIGYTCSKFLAIKFASEAPLSRRVPAVLCLIAFAEAMLILYALTPPPYNIVFLFANGLPLGMVWSMLFGIVEGRRITELLSLGMSVSVIFSSGWVKGVGLWTIDVWGVPGHWMPAVTGMLFVPILLVAMLMLRQLPPPTPEDIAQRTKRAPMDRRARREFLIRFFPGIVMLVGGHVCLMVYRSIRDDFMPDILFELGHRADPGDFARIESGVGVAVIATMCLLSLVRENRLAVWANFLIVAAGALLLGASTLLLQAGGLSPVAFYVLNGIGIYAAFIPYQSILIDRLLASLGTVATASFLIAVDESYGYLSVVATYLGRDIYQSATGTVLPWASMLNLTSYMVMIIVPFTSIGCALYFQSGSRRSNRLPSGE